MVNRDNWRQEEVPVEWADAIFAGKLTQWDIWKEKKIPLGKGERPGLIAFLKWARRGGWKLHYEGDDTTLWGTSPWAAYPRLLMTVTATRDGAMQ